MIGVACSWQHKGLIQHATDAVAVKEHGRSITTGHQNGGECECKEEWSCSVLRCALGRLLDNAKSVLTPMQAGPLRRTLTLRIRPL